MTRNGDQTKPYGSYSKPLAHVFPLFPGLVRVKIRKTSAVGPFFRFIRPDQDHGGIVADFKHLLPGQGGALGLLLLLQQLDQRRSEHGNKVVRRR